MVWCLIACLFIECDVFSQTRVWKERFPSAGLTVGTNPLNPNSLYAESDSGKLYASYDGGGAWSYLSSTHLVGGIRQILVHPSDTTVFFCAGGLATGLLKSTDHGVSWRKVIATLSLDGESIVCDPGHPDTMYAGDFQTGKVYRSSDRGETWTLEGTAGGPICTLEIRADSPNILYAGTGTNGEISKSDDSGATWRIVRHSTSGEIPKIVTARNNQMIGYATSYGAEDSTSSVLKTTDGGETWRRTSLTGIPVWSLTIDQEHPDTVYAGTFPAAATSVYKTTDGGFSWISMGEGLPSGHAVWNLKTIGVNASVLFASLTQGTFGFGGVYSFRAGAVRARIEGAVLDSATHDTVRTGIIENLSTGDAVDLKSSQGSFTLTYVEGDPDLSPSVHVEAYPYYIANIPLSFILDSTATEDVSMRKLPLTSVTGTLADSLGHPVGADVTIDVSVLYGTENLAAHTDSAGRFSFDEIALQYAPLISNYALYVDPQPPSRQLRIDHLAVDTGGVSLTLQTGPADLFLVGEDSANYRSYFQSALDSLGVVPYVWNTVTKGPAPFRSTTLFRRKSVIYFTGTKHTSLSQNELDSLVATLNSGCNLYITGQDFVEKNDSSSFLRNYLGVRFGGNTQYILSSGTPGDQFNGLSFLTVGTDGGNDQTSRDSIVILLPKTKSTMTYGGVGIAAVRLDSAGGRARVILMGFGFEAISPFQKRKAVMQRVLGYFDGSIVLGVEQSTAGPPPARFALAQNYPNPFNPVTRIRYQLPVESRVTLKIYNLLGQVVQLLREGVQGPGFQFAEWDAGRPGEGVSSGIYFYRLDAVGLSDPGRRFTQIRKAVLIR